MLRSTFYRTISNVVVNSTQQQFKNNSYFKYLDVFKRIVTIFKMTGRCNIPFFTVPCSAWKITFFCSKRYFQWLQCVWRKYFVNVKSSKIDISACLNSRNLIYSEIGQLESNALSLKSRVDQKQVLPCRIFTTSQLY